jgi:hypothetical protein
MSSQAITPNTEAAILARVIEADPNEITPDVAEYLLSMQLPREDRARVDELSSKARSGSLTAAEASELDSYLHIGRLLAVMQSRARRRLKNTMPPRCVDLSGLFGNGPANIASTVSFLNSLSVAFSDRSHYCRKAPGSDCRDQSRFGLRSLQPLQGTEHCRSRSGFWSTRPVVSPAERRLGRAFSNGRPSYYGQDPSRSRDH